MAGNDEAEGFGDSVQLRGGYLFQRAIEREVDGGVDQEEVLDLAAGPRRGGFQPNPISAASAPTSAHRSSTGA